MTRQTRTRPVYALAEPVWNSVDAETTARGYHRWCQLCLPYMSPLAAGDTDVEIRL
jgi:hypothetical protein